MKIYLMRHGQTIWNEKGITQGQTQNHLSKKGIESVNLASENLKNKKLDVIICSPLKRAIQTATIMNKYHNIEIIKDNNLIDTNQGIFTGRKYKKLTTEEIKLKQLRSPKTKMESYDSVNLRVRNFANTLKEKYNYKNILIITHTYIASSLEIIFNNKVSFLRVNPWS